jgi:hypothetical protein
LNKLQSIEHIGPTLVSLPLLALMLILSAAWRRDGGGAPRLGVAAKRAVVICRLADTAGQKSGFSSFRRDALREKF